MHIAESNINLFWLYNSVQLVFLNEWVVPGSFFKFVGQSMITVFILLKRRLINRLFIYIYINTHKTVVTGN